MRAGQDEVRQGGGRCPTVTTDSEVVGGVKKYRLRARGWALEVTAHRLTDEDKEVLAKWGGVVENEPNLEEVLPNYNCYSTNLWQSGCVPSSENSSFYLFDDKEVELFHIPSPSSSPDNCWKRDGIGETLEASGGQGDILVYCEESKGRSATWLVFAEKTPEPQDFSFRVAKILVGDEVIEYIEGATYRGQELERDYDDEDLSGKAAYSQLV